MSAYMNGYIWGRTIGTGGGGGNSGGGALGGLVILGILGCAFASNGGQSAAARQTAAFGNWTVPFTQVNMRTCPGVDGCDVISTVSYGDRIEVIAPQGRGWYKIQKADRSVGYARLART